MKTTSRTTLIGLVLAALVAGPAVAEVFTIKLTNDATFISRYQPQQHARDESKISFLSEFGNWITLPKSLVVDITSETESRGFGTVLDTNTIIIGWAPNDKPEEMAPSDDPTTRLLNYMQERDAAQEQDFSVTQFVTTESAGSGGLPASGVTSSGSSSFPVDRSGSLYGNEPQVIDQ